MSEVLYRKYRPQTFDEVVGQEITKHILQNEIKSGDLAHSYLFSGPRGVGKTSIARIFAKSVNCKNRKFDQSEPCNTCELCVDITLGKCFDVLEIDAASHTGVENVRDNIIENIRFTPIRAKYKIFIIDEVHMLSKGAFNALLKTLEEPPSHAIFILATTETQKIPETIVSRCQHFVFKNILRDDLCARIDRIAKKEKIEIEQSVISTIAKHSGGSLRDAESLLGSLIASVGQSGTITNEEAELIIPKTHDALVEQLFESLACYNGESALQHVNNFIDMGVDLDRFYDDCINFGRKLMIGSANFAGTTKFTSSELVSFLEDLIVKKTTMRASPLPQLPLELAVVTFCEKYGKKKTTALAAESTHAVRSTLTNQKIIVKKPEAHPNRYDSNMPTIEDIRLRWNEVLKKASEKNPSLSLMLSASVPLAVIGSVVRFGVKYRFHKERLSTAQMKTGTEEVLREIFNNLFTIEIIISENAAEETSNPLPEKQGMSSDTLLQNVLEQFGGRVVE